MPKEKRTFRTGLSDVSSEEFLKNYTVLRMARYGMSDTAIVDMTGLTHGQVSSRVQKYGLGGHRRALRHGWATESAEIMDLATSYTSKQVSADIKAYNKIRKAILKARNTGG